MGSREVERAIDAIGRAGGLLSAAEVAEVRGVSKSTVANWLAAGKLPPPIKEVGRVKLWLRDQVAPD